MVQLSRQSNRDTRSDLALYTSRTRCSWEPASDVYRRAARTWRSELFASRDFPRHSGRASRSDLIGGSGRDLVCGVNGSNEFCIGALLLTAPPILLRLMLHRRVRRVLSTPTTLSRSPLRRRVEGGYRFATYYGGLTPYAANSPRRSTRRDIPRRISTAVASRSDLTPEAPPTS
jgi:hypothetical protein